MVIHDAHRSRSSHIDLPCEWRNGCFHYSGTNLVRSIRRHFVRRLFRDGEHAAASHECDHDELEPGRVECQYDLLLASGGQKQCGNLYFADVVFHYSYGAASSPGSIQPGFTRQWRHQHGAECIPELVGVQRCYIV